MSDHEETDPGRAAPDDHAARETDQPDAGVPTAAWPPFPKAFSKDPAKDPGEGSAKEPEWPVTITPPPAQTWAAPDSAAPAQPDAGSPPPWGAPTPPGPGVGAGYPPASGYPTSGYPTSGYPTAGYPTAGYPASGYPAAPSAQGGYPTAPAPQGGYPYGYPPTGAYPAPGGPYPPGPGGAEVLQAGAPGGHPDRRGRMVALIVGLVAVLLVITAGGIYLLRGSGTPSAHGSSPAATGGAGQPSAPGPSSMPSVPTSGWTVPVNAYCRQVDLQLKAVPRAQTATQVPVVLRQTGSIVRAMNARLHGMTVPADQKSDYDAMMAAWDRVPGAYDQAATAAANGNQSGVDAALAQSDQANEQGNAIANKLGLADCAGAGGLGGSSSPSSAGSPGATI